MVKWLRDCKCQDQFQIYWGPGKLNYTDYWTKHHPATHHQNISKEFIMPYTIVEMLRLNLLQHARHAPAMA